jgi:hypothetical protein
MLAVHVALMATVPMVCPAQQFVPAYDQPDGAMLSDKARLMEAQLAATNLHHGQVLTACVAAETDTEADKVVAHRDWENVAIWTGIYAAACAAKVHVGEREGWAPDKGWQPGDKIAAYERLWEVLRAIHLLAACTPDGKPVFGRAVLWDDEPEYVASGLPDPSKQEAVKWSNPGPEAPGGVVKWLADPSVDQYGGVFFGLAVTFDVAWKYLDEAVPDDLPDDLKQRLQAVRTDLTDDVQRVATDLVAHRGLIFGHNGKQTTHSGTCRECQAIPGELRKLVPELDWLANPLHVLQVMSWMLTAHRICDGESGLHTGPFYGFYDDIWTAAGEYMGTDGQEDEFQRLPRMRRRLDALMFMFPDCLDSDQHGKIKARVGAYLGEYWGAARTAANLGFDALFRPEGGRYPPTNFNNGNMSFLAAYGLGRFVTHPTDADDGNELRRRKRTVFRKLTVKGLWNHELYRDGHAPSAHENPFWDYVVCQAVAGLYPPESDPTPGEAALTALKQFPQPPLRDVMIRNRRKENGQWVETFEAEPGSVDRLQKQKGVKAPHCGVHPVPVDARLEMGLEPDTLYGCRPPWAFLWTVNPYLLNSIGSENDHDARLMFSGVDYLAAYWLGRAFPVGGTTD